jgi:hypothetical protein
VRVEASGSTARAPLNCSTDTATSASDTGTATVAGVSDGARTMSDTRSVES